MVEFFEALIETAFGELAYGLFRIIGASFRFLFLRKYTFKEVLNQDWNGRVGLFVVLLIASLIVWPFLISLAEIIFFFLFLIKIIF